jgi:N-acetyl-gamma-glutamyl-phosphate reductase
MFSVGVVGASGYAGGELLRLLAGHPDLSVRAAVSGTYKGKPITAAFPSMHGLFPTLRFTAPDDLEALNGCDLIFLAQENGQAMCQAPGLLETGAKVVDLSADFRFRDPAVYAQWYSKPHACPQINAEVVYGLPELHRKEIKGARVVGNPGCYPTASALAVLPLLKANAIDPATIIIDAKSGVSGAGRAKFVLDYMYSEANESVVPYKIAGTHRHTPEIEQTLSGVAGQEVAISFTPHLIPMTRGILSTCYASLTSDHTTETLFDLYEQFYAGHPFIFICRDHLPATKHTLGSNRCHISLAVDKRTNRVTVVSAIDNVVKGAAGQAIQNANLMLGLDETAGLVHAGGIWP